MMINDDTKTMPVETWAFWLIAGSILFFGAIGFITVVEWLCK
jgi:hypothetical protein